MSPQEIQRTMDFILRSQADAVVRMERWDERWEERYARQQQRIDDAFLAIRTAARAVRDLAKETRDHKKRIRSLERSQGRTTTHVDTMRDVIRILTRLEARQAKRLDQLEKNR